MQRLGTLPRGAKVHYKSYTFTILADRENVLLLGDNIGNRPFDADNSCRWIKSSLRKYLNDEFLCEISALRPDGTISDMTADDGETALGICCDKVSLLSCEQYRRYRDIIGKCDYPYWTLTAWCPHNYPCIVRLVDPDGALYNNHGACVPYGVRPLLALDKSILVSDENELLPLDYELASGHARQKGKEK